MHQIKFEKTFFYTKDLNLSCDKSYIFKYGTNLKNNLNVSYFIVYCDL